MNSYFPLGNDTLPVVRFSAALLKVASRCNLNCNYCYVYNHADQSWREQPKLMAHQTVQRFGLRLDEYVAACELDKFSVIFHGGEPLLYTAEGLVGIASQVRSLVRPSCQLDFSLQTNGTLLTEQALGTLVQAGISISLSLDGPQRVNDLHRLDHTQGSSFERTLNALKLLMAAEADIFSGVIAVVDPWVSPRELFDFFAPMSLPRLDLLLPDATHASLPPGRAEDEGCYRRWLEEAFELWFREYPSLPIRWFDAVLGSRLGIPSPTDVMGLGSVSLIVIETDGSYTDHDVFKITGPGEGQLGASVFSASFLEIAHNPKIREHGYRLTFDGLAKECKACPIVEACGGGCVMHRAHPERRLDTPTVYCSEMFGLTSMATRVMRESLASSAEGPLEPFNGRGAGLVERCSKWRRDTEQEANRRAQLLNFDRGGASAAAILLSLANSGASEPFTIPGEIVPAARWLTSIRIQASDPRLVEPFLSDIRFLSPNSAKMRHAIDSLDRIEAYFRAFDPSLLAAMDVLISDIIFVESTLADESGIFSFSDDKAPNVLYIAPYAGGSPIAPDDLADSIYHEFLHQILYHFERSGALLFDHIYPRFPAPWRPGLRQSGGFLHGTFVFAGLAKFWEALAKVDLPGLDREKARHNADWTARQATYGIRSLREFALLTPRGIGVVEELAKELGVSSERMQAPGLMKVVS